MSNEYLGGGEINDISVIALISMQCNYMMRYVNTKSLTFNRESLPMGLGLGLGYLKVLQFEHRIYSK